MRFEPPIDRVGRIYAAMPLGVSSSFATASCARRHPAVPSGNILGDSVRHVCVVALGYGLTTHSTGRAGTGLLSSERRWRRAG